MGFWFTRGAANDREYTPELGGVMRALTSLKEAVDSLEHYLESVREFPFADEKTEFAIQANKFLDNLKSNSKKLREVVDDLAHKNLPSSGVFLEVSRLLADKTREGNILFVQPLKETFSEREKDSLTKNLLSFEKRIDACLALVGEESGKQIQRQLEKGAKKAA